ncbi:MAG: succinate dehydrogenase cytochrome b subunit [Deltaproteobacteria bacterium]|nr:succinate dehydrogenase cytochrome b subunit [Deltaproteobacteria bacterium]
MTKQTGIMSSSIGRKLIMAVTGVFLCSFLVVHLAGNLLLFRDDGGVAFTAYARFMASNLLIRVLEIGLVGGFLFHIVDAAVLSKANRNARPVRYATERPKGGGSWISRHMGITGSVIFLFLVVHLRTFFVEHRILGADASLYDLIRAAFANPLYVGLYVTAMVLLAFHLYHGFHSAFCTLGVTRRRYTTLITAFGVLFSIGVPAGFASIPLYFYFVR